MRPLPASDVVCLVTRDQWGTDLIRSWNTGWWDLQIELGDLLAPVIGARAGEVIISDSTSVNLYKLASAALRARPGRHRILTDDLNFPTDVYVLSGLAGDTVDGHTLEIVPSSDGINGPAAQLEAAFDDDVALLALSSTCFKSGYTYDIGRLTAAAHDAGALVLWDLSHSAGAVELELTRWGVDLAVGCTYKYLNGGPGSPAFLYVRQDLQGTLSNPITAWWAHENPFAMELEFAAVDGIRRFHTGTMPVLSLARDAARHRTDRAGGYAGNQNEVASPHRVLHRSGRRSPAAARLLPRLAARRRAPRFPRVARA